MAKGKSQKIRKGGKVVGYSVPTPDGGQFLVRGGKGKKGVIGRIKPEKKK